MTTILIVDDEPVAVDSLAYSLRREGYNVSISPSSGDAPGLIERIMPDMVILDLAQPGMEGLEVCRRLRARSPVPIIILSNRGEELDKVLGLEIGADDYLAKPYSQRELLARIRTLLRRVALDKQPEGTVNYQIGSITLDSVGRRVLKDKSEIQLSMREFDLVAFLISQAGRACSRQELLNQVWGKDWSGDPRTLEVHIRWLRMKIEDNPTQPIYILTIRGFGYRFATADEVA